MKSYSHSGYSETQFADGSVIRNAMEKCEPLYHSERYVLRLCAHSQCFVPFRDAMIDHSCRHRTFVKGYTPRLHTLPELVKADPAYFHDWLGPTYSTVRNASGAGYFETVEFR